MATTATVRAMLHSEAEASSSSLSSSSSASAQSQRAAARLRTISGEHGQRLACFRPRQRFTVKPTCRAGTIMADVVCACAHEPLQCRLVSSDDAAAAVSIRHQVTARRKKWVDKFESHDWEKHALLTTRVCQKWRENQKKLPRLKKKKHSVDDVSQLDDSAVLVDDDLDDCLLEDPPLKTSTSKAVKNAISSFASAAEMILQSSKFDALLRAGVPPHLRGQVWWLCSGAAQKRDAACDVDSYPALVRKIPTLSKRASLEIEKDLPRTFPNDTPSGDKDLRACTMKELRRVLQAYCLRNPGIGYCQSMNFIAAVLLQFLEEEEAFWVLVAIVEDLIPQFHTKSMLGSRAEQRVFSELVQLKLPLVYQHIQHLGVDLEPFTLKWFLCLFLNTLPLEPVMRIWDVFFCEGSHVLLRVGLTLLKLAQPRILASEDAIDVYEMFKFSHEILVDLTAPHRSGLLNRDECVCDTLIRLAMDKSFLGAIAFDSLYELRHLYRNEVAAEMKAADERRAAHRTLRTAGSSSSSSDDEFDDEEVLLAQVRHAETERELLEYDFVEEYAYHCGDVSPSKHIYFSEYRDGSATSSASGEIYVDVDYEGVPCNLN